MGKTVEVKECGTPLKIEAYGIGVRYACPVCDKGCMFRISSIVWTNGTPPADRVCHKPAKLAMNHP